MKKEIKYTDKGYSYIECTREECYKWGIASFKYNEDEDYWYLRTYGNFNPNVDWYDFGCLVQLGYKWIKDGCLYDNPELLGGE